MTVSEMLQAIHDNDLFDMFLEFPICDTYPYSKTCYIVFCRTIIQCVAQIKNVLGRACLRNTMGQNRTY